MPGNPADRRAGAVITPAANKLIRGAAQAAALSADNLALSQSSALPAATTPSEQAIPAGIIAMWSGLKADIPDGWSLCDGTNDTPDLREFYVKSIGTDPSEEPGTTGGRLTHKHTPGTLQLDPASAGTPAGTIDDHTTTAVQSGAGTTVLNGPTTHTFTGAPLGTHVHTFASGSETDEQNHEPPFYKLAFIMKL